MDQVYIFDPDQLNDFMANGFDINEILQMQNLILNNIDTRQDSIRDDNDHRNSQNKISPPDLNNEDSGIGNASVQSFQTEQSASPQDQRHENATLPNSHTESTLMPVQQFDSDTESESETCSDSDTCSESDSDSESNETGQKKAEADSPSEPVHEKKWDISKFEIYDSARKLLLLSFKPEYLEVGNIKSKKKIKKFEKRKRHGRPGRIYNQRQKIKRADRFGRRAFGATEDYQIDSILKSRRSKGVLKYQVDWTSLWVTESFALKNYPKAKKFIREEKEKEATAKREMENAQRKVQLDEEICVKKSTLKALKLVDALARIDIKKKQMKIRAAFECKESQ